MLARNSFDPQFADRVAFCALSVPVTGHTGDRREFLGRNGSARGPRRPAEAAPSAGRRARASTRAPPCSASWSWSPGRRGSSPSSSAPPTGTRRRAAPSPGTGSRARAAAAADAQRGGVGGAPLGDLGADSGAVLRRDAQPLDAVPGALLPHVGPLRALPEQRRVRLPRPAPGRAGVRLRGARGGARAHPARRRAAVRGGRRAALVAPAERAGRPHPLLGRPRLAPLRGGPIRARHGGRIACSTSPSPSSPCAPWSPHEHEVYDLPGVSEEHASVYEHCLRALRRACTSGAHGLPLIGSRRLERRDEPRGRRGARRERLARVVPRRDPARVRRARRGARRLAGRGRPPGAGGRLRGRGRGARVGRRMVPPRLLRRRHAARLRARATSAASTPSRRAGA